MKPISQREARRLRKRVQQLESERSEMVRLWGSDYPGTHINALTVDAVGDAIIRTAIRLGRPVVLRPARDCEFYVYAVRG